MRQFPLLVIPAEADTQGDRIWLGRQLPCGSVARKSSDTEFHRVHTEFHREAIRHFARVVATFVPNSGA